MMSFNTDEALKGLPSSSKELKQNELGPVDDNLSTTKPDDSMNRGWEHLTVLGEVEIDGFILLSSCESPRPVTEAEAVQSQPDPSPSPAPAPAPAPAQVPSPAQVPTSLSTYVAFRLKGSPAANSACNVSHHWPTEKVLLLKYESEDEELYTNQLAELKRLGYGQSVLQELQFSYNCFDSFFPQNPTMFPRLPPWVHQQRRQMLVTQQADYEEVLRKRTRPSFPPPPSPSSSSPKHPHPDPRPDPRPHNGGNDIDIYVPSAVSAGGQSAPPPPPPLPLVGAPAPAPALGPAIIRRYLT